MKVKKFQQGGAAPAQGGLEEQVAGMAQELIQQLGPDASALLAQTIMQMLQGAAQEAPEAPAYQRKGGKLVRVGK